MTVAIAYNGGAYGTYLEWCLTALTSYSSIDLPFTKLGNSHQFLGNHVGNINGWKKYINSPCHLGIARLHPKVRQSESLSANMDYICDTASSVVYLYPDRNSVLLCVNNYFSKIWTDWMSSQTEFSIEKIYNSWPVSKDTPIGDIDPWIKREFLSLFQMSAWFDQIEWYHPDNWSNPKCHVVTISELLRNFESTIELICDKTGIVPIRKVSTLLTAHTRNLELQQYLTHDQLCNNIIQSTIASVCMEWEPLSLPSEAWLQWELKNQGWQIKCNGLDIFPTNSVQLRELLYPV